MISEPAITQPVPTAPVPVQTLQYAMPETLVGVDARRAFRVLFIVSILSGLCVGSCFLCFTQNPLAYFVHVALYATTIALAVRGGVLFAKLSPIQGDRRNTVRLILDLIATGGLVIIGLAPIVYLATGDFSGMEKFAAVVIGLAYLMLAATTWRHVLLYRSLAEICRQINRFGMAKQLIGLGWTKAIYELIWLGCCTLTLFTAAISDHSGNPNLDGVAIYFAFAALVGIGPFAFIWIWMIVTHALLLRLAR